jgi:hypothetical protein
MNQPSLTALTVLSLCVLAGCSPKSGGNATAGGPDSAITAADMPHVRVGYWEETKSDDGGPPKTSRECSDGTLVLPGAFVPDSCVPGATEPAAPSSGQDTTNQVSLHYVTFLPGTVKRTSSSSIVVDIACTQGPNSSSLHTTITGDLDTSYVIDSKTSMGAGAGPPEVHTTHWAYRFIGPCPSS